MNVLIIFVLIVAEKIFIRKYVNKQQRFKNIA